MTLYQAFRLAFEHAHGNELRFRQIIAGLSRHPAARVYGKRRIRVRALVRPDLDVDKLASALLALASEPMSRDD